MSLRICLHTVPGGFPRDATSGAETEQSPTLPPEAIASPRKILLQSLPLLLDRRDLSSVSSYSEDAMAKRARSRSPSRSPIHLRPRANLSPDRYKVAEHIASTLREDRTYVDRLRSREESEDEETEERSHETARRRSDARAVRRNEPLKRHIAS